jgi:hypothetical protein
MGTIVGAGEEVDEVDDDSSDRTNRCQDVAIPVYECGCPEKVMQFLQLPKDVSLFDINPELLVILTQFLPLLSVDDLDSSELEIPIRIILEVEHLSADIAVGLHQHSHRLAHDYHDAGEPQVLTSGEVHRD